MTVGSFIWCELTTTDTDAAAAFYGGVVGWTSEPSPEHEGYFLLKRGEQVAGGLMLLPEPARANGPRWSGYIHVADADREAAAIRENGGRVFFGPADIPHVGRFAVVGDPEGAEFSILAPQPRAETPMLAAGEPGTAVWRELRTGDQEAAFDFYAGRFGWEKETAVDMGPMGTYQTFRAGGASAGGMMNDPAARPAWRHYFAVADIDAAHRAVTAGGGKMSNGPNEIPGGDFALSAVDPQGAAFGLVGPRRA